MTRRYGGYVLTDRKPIPGSSTQGSLFEVATYANCLMPGSQPSRTSREAARRLYPTISQKRLRVLRAFATVTDATADEIAALLGLLNTQTRPRCTEMLRLGYLVDTGTERPTPLGGTAAVLKITQHGRKYLADFCHTPTMRRAG